MLPWLAFALVLWIPLIGNAQTPVEPEGYYESQPGKAGELNRMSVWKLESGGYRVGIRTVYCAYAFSPDCANARFGEIYFDAALKSDRLSHREAATRCFVEVRFNRNLGVVRQTGDCPGLPYADAGGSYRKVDSTPQELSP